MMLTAILILTFLAPIDDPTKAPPTDRVGGMLFGAYDSLGGPACVVHDDKGRDTYLIFKDVMSEDAALTMHGNKVIVTGQRVVRGGRFWFFATTVRRQ